MDVNILNPEWIIALTGVGGAILGLVIWLVRLEGKIRQNDKDIDRIDANSIQLEKKSDTVFEKIFDKLSTIEITLAKVEGKLSNEKAKS